MDIVEIQAIYYMVAATGVLIAAAYYVQNLRINEKTRRRDMVLQRLNPSSREFQKALGKVLTMTDWATIREYREKYSHWVNIEAYADYNYVINHFNALGILLKDGIVSADQIFQLYSPYSIISVYEKFEPVIAVSRITLEGEVHSEWNKPYEYLYREAKRMYPKIRKLPESREEFIERGRMFDELFRENPNPNA